MTCREIELDLRFDCRICFPESVARRVAAFVCAGAARGDLKQFEDSCLQRSHRSTPCTVTQSYCDVYAKTITIHDSSTIFDRITSARAQHYQARALSPAAVGASSNSKLAAHALRVQQTDPQTDPATTIAVSSAAERLHQRQRQHQASRVAPHIRVRQMLARGARSCPDADRASTDKSRTDRSTSVARCLRRPLRLPRLRIPLGSAAVNLDCHRQQARCWYSRLHLPQHCRTATAGA